MPSKVPIPRAIRERLVILQAALAMVLSLLSLGLSPMVTAVVTVVGCWGAVEIGCRLTGLDPAPRVRTVVVVVVFVYIIRVLKLGYPPIPALAVVLGTAFAVVEVTRRLSGMIIQPPQTA
jgi:hypothetical protein